MTYIERLNEQTVRRFINKLLTNEFMLFYHTDKFLHSFNSFFKVNNQDGKIVVECNHNVGLCCYNIYYLDDYTCTSLYPTCKKSYTNEWREFLSRQFRDEYKNDLKKHLENEQTK